MVKFIAKVCVATPPERKLALLWDNASSHKARFVKDYLVDVGVTAISNVPYHPQFNGIEHVFSDVRRRYRKTITMLKINGADDIDLSAVLKQTFDSTDPQVVIAHCMQGWRNLLKADPRCPSRFQGRPVNK